MCPDQQDAKFQLWSSEFPAICCKQNLVQLAMYSVPLPPIVACLMSSICSVEWLVRVARHKCTRDHLWGSTWPLSYCTEHQHII